MAQQRLRDGFAQLVQSARRFSLSRDSFFWLWRSGALGRPATQEGFILPTVTLLLLILSLVVGLLIFRTFNRTEQVSGERKQKVIYNYATPAVDRAKAKIEYLFTAEALALPPSDDSLSSLLKKATYDLPGETRLNLDGVGTCTGTDRSGCDPGWTYEADIDGDGKKERVAYSLLTAANSVKRNAAGAIIPGGLAIESPVTLQKARDLVTRNGPINLLGSSSGAQCQNVTTVKEKAWQDIGKVLRKALQVNAVVIGSKQGGQVPVATLEMQQDREAPKSPKWGAWFRTDLEMTPGPTFRWNGAMHSEGSLLFASNSNPGTELHLISSPRSCVFDIEASTITTREREETDPAGVKYMHKGHIVAGSIRDNNYVNRTVGFKPFSDSVTDATAFRPLNTGNDSLDQSKTTPPSETQAITLDPIVLFNEDRNATRLGANLPVSGNPPKKQLPGDIEQFFDQTKNEMPGRVVKRLTDDSQPYVDDTFRADNRYGPKPNYKPADGKGDPIKLGGPGKLVGDPIDSNDTLLNLESPTVDAGIGANARKADPYDETTYGYDGYWERRAKNQGVRVIVGQRLELGNAFGWNGTAGPTAGTYDDEPLYPPKPDASSAGAFSTRRHEQKQLRTLRDNLAAVQATAIYHYRRNGETLADPKAKSTDIGKSSGGFPVACLATTAHPGTPATIKASTTFGTVTTGSTTNINTDFLTGKGTNGWEFAPPGGNEAGFKTALNGDLGDALRNLAHFAGDPEGGLPGHKALANADLNRIYPDPTQTMWGDFSMLRRITDANSNLNTAYDDLSPADKSTLHTAACTVQMLAYNVENVQQSAMLASIKDDKAKLDLLAAALSDKVYLEAFAKFPKDPTATPGSVDVTGTGPGTGMLYTYVKDKKGDVALALELQSLVASTIAKLQIDRDRRYGFKRLSTSGDATKYTYKKSLSYKIWQQGASGLWKADIVKTKIDVGFDWSTTNNLGLGDEGVDSKSEEQRFVQIADKIASGSSLANPKYPSLFYVLPLADHDFDGDTTAGNDQPDAEDYIYNGIASNATAPKTKLGAFLHGGYPFRDINVASIVGTPRPAPSATNTAPSGWLTPVRGAATNAQTCTTGNACNIVSYQPPAVAGVNPPLRYVRTGFLDKVMYNNREGMAVRVLDLDLDLLRNTALNGSTDKRDSWLPIPNFTPTDATYQTKTGAVYYVFREDAIREDTIQRQPATNTPLTKLSDYMSLTGTFTAATDYWMNAVGPLSGTGRQQDMPRTDLGISPKSVDFFADPDRRPYGFRLRNGSDIRRLNLSDNTDNMRGLSLISDNPVYVQDQFNLHTQQEFGEPLEEEWGNFYARKDLNSNFACEAGSSSSCSIGDQWRPVEIIADSITLLSSNFRDGSIAQGLLADSNLTSFSPAQVPLEGTSQADVKWITESGTELIVPPTALPSATPTRCEDDATQLWDYYGINSTTARVPAFPCLPVKVDRDNYFVGKGNGAISSVGKDGAFRTVAGQAVNFKLRGSSGLLIGSIQTIYNMTFVSGTTPARPNNNSGGMHNFPRMLETWGNLIFSGAMVQLNFSNYATAPFDQDSWEPGSVANGTEPIQYYGAPTRRWGYDVALQYAPAGPISQRFLAPRKTRSEFYRDLPVDDPYVKLLRCSTPVGGSAQIDPSASTAECTP
jgi:hypothetical protein